MGVSSGGSGSTPRLGARVLLLDPAERVLLTHACNPAEPSHHWWELPGGGLDPDEPAPEAARRELAEETGILPDGLGPLLWVRDTHVRHRGRRHHRREAVYLAYTNTPRPRVRPHTRHERAGTLGHRWWTQPELAGSPDKLLPPALPNLLADLLAGRWHGPLELTT